METVLTDNDHSLKRVREDFEKDEVVLEIVKIISDLFFQDDINILRQLLQHLREIDK